MRAQVAVLLSLGLVTAGCGAVSGLPGIIPAGDTVPPAIGSTAPAPDATAPADGTISITFNEPMNTRSLTITAEPPIAFGPGQWSTDERTVTFRPEAPFSLGTVYTVSVTGKDRAGNAMASFSWRFTASTPGTRAGTGEARLAGKVEARADERVFTLFAALNASGYDDGMKEAGVVREAVRDKMGDLPIKLLEPFRKFRAEHPQTLDSYISYALNLTAPPDFAEQRAASGLDRLNRILADFYAAAKIADQWKEYTEAHAKAAAAFITGGPSIIGKVLDYLRATELPAARIVLVPNLLDAPGQAYLTRTPDAVIFVIGTVSTLERRALTLLTTRLLLTSARHDSAAELQLTEPLYDLIRESAKQRGYGPWEQVVRESLAAAVTAQLAFSVEQREPFLREQYARGLILADHFAAELAKYEQSTVPLIEFLPQMLRSVNLDEERRRFAERKR